MSEASIAKTRVVTHRASKIAALLVARRKSIYSSSVLCSAGGCTPDPLHQISMTQALQPAQLQHMLNGDRLYPKPADFYPSYGTAGFRSVAERLPSTVYRY